MSIEDQVAALEQGMGVIAQQLATQSQQQNNPYLGIRTTFGMQGQTIPYAPGMGPADTGKGDYITNSAGQLLYKNGVIVDPSSGDIMFPTVGAGIDPADVPGSPEWLAKIQDSWTEAKANKWRKLLWDQGYVGSESGGLQSKKGGMAYDLLNALKTYHSNRYLNFGKVQPIAPGEGNVRPADFGGALDPAVLKQHVSAWFQEAYGDDPSDDEAEFWAKKLRSTAMRLAEEKGLDPTAAGTVAQARTYNKFKDTPEVADQMQSMEEDEMDERMRTGLISISQLASI